MNIQQKNSAHHFRMQSEREQTLAIYFVIQQGTDPMNCIGNIVPRNIISNIFGFQDPIITTILQ